jgi:hypothetical protein
LRTVNISKGGHQSLGVSVLSKKQLGNSSFPLSGFDGHYTNEATPQAKHLLNRRGAETQRIGENGSLRLRVSAVKT